MASLIRVKRRLEDDPIEAILLNCKKQKLNEEAELVELSALLQLAGTTNTQDADISKFIKKPTKLHLEEQFKKHSVNLTEKYRSQNKESSKNNRYKFVNCHRAQNGGASSSSQAADVTIFDIESHSDDSNFNTEYVYDYYTTSDDLEDAISASINVYPLGDELIYGSLRDNGIDDDADSDDTDDSNAECNWRNDYPDTSGESDPESVTGDDMEKAMRKLDFDDSDDSDYLDSSDPAVDLEAGGHALEWQGYSPKLENKLNEYDKFFALHHDLLG